MKMSSALRAALLALIAFAGTHAVLRLACRRRLRATHDLQGGLDHRRLRRQRLADLPGRTYGLSTGGLDYGLVFGGSKTVLRGRVSNIYRPSDVAGVYGAAGAGLAVGRGARAIVLTNQKGAVLELSGSQTGLMANADLSGLAITMR